jgi:hypothetical protein
VPLPLEHPAAAANAKTTKMTRLMLALSWFIFALARRGKRRRGKAAIVSKLLRPWQRSDAPPATCRADPYRQTFNFIGSFLFVT